MSSSRSRYRAGGLGMMLVSEFVDEVRKGIEALGGRLHSRQATVLANVTATRFADIEMRVTALEARGE